MKIHAVIGGRGAGYVFAAIMALAAWALRHEETANSWAARKSQARRRRRTGGAELWIL